MQGRIGCNNKHPIKRLQVSPSSTSSIPVISMLFVILFRLSCRKRNMFFAFVLFVETKPLRNVLVFLESCSLPQSIFCAYEWKLCSQAKIKDRSVLLPARAQAVSLLQQLKHPVWALCSPHIHDMGRSLVGFVGFCFLGFTCCRFTPSFLFMGMR